MFKLSKQQQEAVDSNARIKLIMGANRSGKTTVLLRCLLKEMKKLNSKDAKVVIYEINNGFSEFIAREIKYNFRDIIYTCMYHKDRITFETTYGIIEITTGFVETIESCDIVVVDGASRNKYLKEILSSYSGYCNENGLTKLIIAGHCPEDTKNFFYRQWCTAFYSYIKDTEAFKLRTWDNPAMAPRKEQWEKEILPNMGLERYIRDYYATII